MSRYSTTNLIKFIEHIQATALMLPSQIIGVKDLNSRYIYCSPSYKELLGTSPANVVGKHGMFISDTNEEARIKEDNEIIATKKPKAFLHIDKIKSRLTPLTFIKSPIIDPDNQEVIGVLCQAFEFATIDPREQLLRAYDNLPSIEGTLRGGCPKLTRREKQVIFLFLSNLNSQEITEVFYKLEGKKVSKSTIDSLFTDQLFPKFEVYNRQALYAKLINLGYNRLIPEEMLISQTFMLDTQSIY